MGYEQLAQRSGQRVEKKLQQQIDALVTGGVNIDTNIEQNQGSDTTVPSTKATFDYVNTKAAEAETNATRAAKTYTDTQIGSIPTPTVDFNQLQNKPAIDGTTLSSNSTKAALDIAAQSTTYNKTEVDNKLNEKISTNVIETSLTGASNKLPDSKAIKNYVDTEIQKAYNEEVYVYAAGLNIKAPALIIHQQVLYLCLTNIPNTTDWQTDSANMIKVDTTVDLTDYYNKLQVDGFLGNKLDTSLLEATLTGSAGKIGDSQGTKQYIDNSLTTQLANKLDTSLLENSLTGTVGKIADSKGVKDYVDGKTISYNNTTNKPQIQGITLEGNKTAADLSLALASSVPAKSTNINTDATNNDKFVTPKAVSDYVTSQIANSFTPQAVNYAAGITINKGSLVIHNQNLYLCLTTIQTTTDWATDSANMSQVNTTIDLTNYYTKQEMDDYIKVYVPHSDAGRYNQGNITVNNEDELYEALLLAASHRGNINKSNGSITYFQIVLGSNITITKSFSINGITFAANGGINVNGRSLTFTGTGSLTFTNSYLTLYHGGTINANGTVNCINLYNSYMQLFAHQQHWQFTAPASSTVNQVFLLANNSCMENFQAGYNNNFNGVGLAELQFSKIVYRRHGNMNNLNGKKIIRLTKGSIGFYEGGNNSNLCNLADNPNTFTYDGIWIPQRV